AASAPLSRLAADAASGTARPAVGSGGTRRCAAVARAALDRRHREPDRACPLSSLKERIELAALFQRMQIVGAADVSFADEDLRHGPPAGSLHQPEARLVVAGDVDLLVGDHL